MSLNWTVKTIQLGTTILHETGKFKEKWELLKLYDLPINFNYQPTAT